MPDIDWCARAEELRTARDSLITGKGVSSVRSGNDQVDYSRADLPRLDRLIAEAEGKCAEASGQRRRYARSVRMRPY